MRTWTAIAIGLACVWLEGCAAREHTDVAAPPRVEQQRLTTSRLDGMGTNEAIESEVERKFAAEGRVDDVSVEVTASDGVVTLSGHVAVERQKRRFAALAETVEGVERVENRLVVARAQAARHRPAARRSTEGPGPIPEVMPGFE